MFRFTILLCLFLLFPVCGHAQKSQYDIAYIWDSDLENVLDYQEELETVLGPEAALRLRIVRRSQGDFGIIYDMNGTALSTARLMVKHSVLLRDAGMAECFALGDSGYFELFNVSYALGPNLDAMEKLYAKVYKYLGSEVGNNLFIEKTNQDNYTLIYRRRADRVSTYLVARKHAKILKKIRLRPSITPERNNPVIYGESSHLDDTVVTEPVVVDNKVDVPNEPVVISTVAKEAVAGSTTPPAPIMKSSVDQFEAPIEGEIESYIKNLRRKGKLAQDERTGWVVFDLTTGKSLVDINADQIFQAASMIKPFVALAFFHQVKEGKLVYGPKSRRNMEKMIQRSDNRATNWVMRMAGGPAKCEAILRTHYNNIFQKTIITEYIPAGGRTYKNSAALTDYIRFLQALWNNQLPYGKEIRRLMSLPGRDRLYNGTPIPQGTLVYNKTGSTAHLCGDMGILVPKGKNGKRYPYALAAVIQRSSRPKNYGQWMLTRGNVIRQVSTLVYKEMKKQHQLM
jgi:beta-lactamase class A